MKKNSNGRASRKYQVKGAGRLLVAFLVVCAGLSYGQGAGVNNLQERSLQVPTSMCVAEGREQSGSVYEAALACYNAGKYQRAGFGEEVADEISSQGL